MKKILLILSILILSFTVSNSQVLAKSWTGNCVGTGTAEDVATIQGIQCVIGNLLNVVMTVFAFGGFIMFVYGSIVWMLAGGQSSNLEKARHTFTYAIFGLILAVSSFIIIQIITYFTGIKSFMKIEFLPNTSSYIQKNLIKNA